MPEVELDETAAIALVREGYDAVAAQYLALTRDVPETHPRRERVEALLRRLPHAADILEIGCGPGVPVARRIVDAGHRYTGVDISERQIALARRHVPEGHFIVSDIGAVQFQQSCFDAALMLYAITHVPMRRWAVLARSVRRWLRPDGMLLVNVPGHGSPGWLEEDFLGFGAHNWTNGLDHVQTVELLDRSGFDVTDDVQLADDEPGPGWFWITAQRRG